VFDSAVCFFPSAEQTGISEQRLTYCTLRGTLVEKGSPEI